MELSSRDYTADYNYTVASSLDSPSPGNSSSSSSSSSASAYGPAELNLPYAVCEVLVAVCAVLGNGLVIIVFSKDRKLRRRTNYYIISLATADLLVGLFAIPFAILASIGLPTNLYACLFTVSVLVVLCTISIFCLVAVSVDRYWAILHPMGYSRNVRTKTAIGIICVCWIAGTLVGFLPLLGWNAGKKSDEKCIFVEVMDYDYLVFLYFATIIFPALLIAAFYAHIYRVVVKQLRQIVTMNPGRRTDNQTTGTMLRLLGAAQKRDVKATQNLSRIVAFFIVCWFPLYTINCVKAFCPDCEVNQVLLNSSIILSHLNSVGNPLLYAYHLKDFRAALKSFIYRLLFPSAPAPKSKKAPSVISEHRASLRTAHARAANPSGGGTSIAHALRTPRTSLLRRATDNAAAHAPSIGAARAAIGSSESPLDSRAASPEVEPEVASSSRTSTPATSSERRECDAFVSRNVSPSSSDLLRNDDSPTIGNREICVIDASAPPIVRLSAIELRTYRTYVRFAEPEDFGEETSGSIFVTEADVNRVSSIERLTAATSDVDLTIDGGEINERADG